MTDAHASRSVVALVALADPDDGEGRRGLVERLALPRASGVLAVVARRFRFAMHPVLARETIVQPADTLPTPPPRLAVIDDDADARELFSEYLRFEGFVVEELEGAEDALAYLERERVDAIITDITLAGLSGSDVARAVRREPRTRALPIVAVTGLPAADLGEDRDLFDDVLVKPVDPAHLVATLHALLCARRASGA